MIDCVDVTELSGDEVSQEQVERLCHRYYWAGELRRGKVPISGAKKELHDVNPSPRAQGRVGVKVCHVACTFETDAASANYTRPNG